MPYKVKIGNKDFLMKLFQQKISKGSEVFGNNWCKNNRSAFRTMDAKIVKVAKAKKK